MGNTVGAPIVSDYLEDEIGPIVSQHSMGESRFLKTLKAIHDLEGHVVVKIYKKRNTKESLLEYKKLLEEIRGSIEFNTALNLMPYQNFLETERSGYLIRQYFSNNLYDRLSTRPFLSIIEKKFISYQILQALIQQFFKGVSHGDIKCENVMITSTNWVYLVDFACYKPTFIPEDNPADFSFYFDNGRRTCYLAPERFYESNKGPPKEKDLTIKMDIFSAGCVIGELFLEGVSVFNLEKLHAYRSGAYNPEPIIRRIPDLHIQSLILHMIQRDPECRFTPEKYIRDWTDKAFPSYFGFLQKFIPSLMKYEHDDRIQCIIDRFDEIIDIFTKPFDPSIYNSLGGTNISSSNVGSGIGQIPANQSPTIPPQSPPLQSATPSPPGTPSLKDRDQQQKLHQSLNLQQLNNSISNIIWEGENFIKECDKSTNESLLNQQMNNNTSQNNQNNQNNGEKIHPIPVSTTCNDKIKQTQESPSTSTNTPQYIEGLDLLLAIIYPSLRHCQYPQTMVNCVGSLFVKMAMHLDDECRLQKIIPYIISMISPEQPPLVRAEALRSLSKVLDMVQTFTPSDSSIFPQYILPSLANVTEGSEEIVRIAYAEILPQLATNAKRFLEIAQHYRDSEGMDRKDLQKYKVYDAELSELQDLFYGKVSDLLTKDSCNTVKRIILSDIYKLCLFFGRQKTNDSLLPLITTFLNDKDWQLRCAFFENIVSVCTVVGANSLESFIYPMTLEALTDEEEFVTERALASLCELTELGLFRKAILLELLVKASPLLLHPNNWIRYTVISLITKISNRLSRTDIYCYMKPRISQYLVADISESITEANLLQLLIPPISRESFNIVVNPIHRHLFPPANYNNSNNSSPLLAPSTGLGSSHSSGSYRRLRDISKELFISKNQLNNSSSNNNNNNSNNNVGSSGSLPLNLSTSSLGSSTSSLSPQSNAMEIAPFELPEEFSFLKQLNIPEVDQKKIIKIFNYIRSKKIFSKFDEHIDSYEPTLPIHRRQASSYGMGSQNNDIGGSGGKIVRIARIKPVGVDNTQQNLTSTPQTPSTGIVGGQIQPQLTGGGTGGNPLGGVGGVGGGMQGIGGNSIGGGISGLNINVPGGGMGTNPNTLTGNVTGVDFVNMSDITTVNKKFLINSTRIGANVLSMEVTTECHLRSPLPLPDLGGPSEYGVQGLPGALPSWKPSGILVSHFIEHKAAVNEIQVSSDNLFFATASNDGTVKIWDCLRMEKGVTNRARQTYSQEGCITSITICDRSHTIASASDKGSIHVFRVGIGGRQKNGNIKYPGLSTVKNILDCEGPIVSVDHFNTNSASIITYATSKGGIHGWDLRSQQEIFLLNNELSLGLIQAFLIDPSRNWLVTATSRGFLTCWDLRFKIPLYSERVTNGRIFKMSPYFGSKFSSESWIFLAADSKDNVIVWDLAAKAVTRVFKRTFIDHSSGGNQTPTGNDASNNNNNMSGNPLNSSTYMTSLSQSSNIFSSQIGGPSANTLSEYDFGVDGMKPSPTNPSPMTMRINSSGISHSTINLPPYALPPSSQLLSAPNTPITSLQQSPATSVQQQQSGEGGKKTPAVRAILSPSQCSYLVTAGDDKRIKYWDWDNPTQSYYISPGKEPPLPHTNKVSFKPNGAQIQEEVWAGDTSGATNSSSTQSPYSTHSSTIGSSTRSKQKSPSIHHQETILDLKIMEVPQPMLISSSADGVVKIWK